MKKLVITSIITSILLSSCSWGSSSESTGTSATGASTIQNISGAIVTFDDMVSATAQENTMSPLDEWKTIYTAADLWSDELKTADARYSQALFSNTPKEQLLALRLQRKQLLTEFKQSEPYRTRLLEKEARIKELNAIINASPQKLTMDEMEEYVSNN